MELRSICEQADETIMFAQNRISEIELADYSIYATDELGGFQSKPLTGILINF